VDLQDAHIGTQGADLDHACEVLGRLFGLGQSA
jgi:hypothetical protein